MAGRLARAHSAVTRWWCVVGCALAAGCGAHVGDGALVGTWRMVRVESLDSASGVWRRPFGDAPTGFVTYGADGSHTMQFHATPVAPAFASGTDRGATSAELQRSFYDYFAWYGSYRVDRARRVVTHVIDGSLWPTWRGTEQARPYFIRNDTLVLGDTLRSRRVLVRQLKAPP
jgi:hypothetical protein